MRDSQKLIAQQQFDEALNKDQSFGGGGQTPPGGQSALLRLDPFVRDRLFNLKRRFSLFLAS